MKTLNLMIVATLALAATACDGSKKANVSQDSNGFCTERFVEDYNAVTQAFRLASTKSTLEACANFTGVHKPGVTCQARDINTFQSVTADSSTIHNVCNELRGKAGQAQNAIRIGGEIQVVE